MTGRRLAAVIWRQAFAGILAEAMAAALLERVVQALVMVSNICTITVVNLLYSAR
jgi:hypothetical protein